MVEATAFCQRLSFLPGVVLLRPYGAVLKDGSLPTAHAVGYSLAPRTGLGLFLAGLDGDDF